MGFHSVFFSEGLALPKIKKDWQKILQNFNVVGDF